jgi:hypothetical protein
MRPRQLLGVLAVLLLILAIWLVPMALAASGSSHGAGDQTQAAPSGAQCPFLQAHPWLDPHGSSDGAGGPAATGGASGENDYY